MKWFGMLGLPAMLLLGSGATDRQQRPDFSGTWTLVEFRIGNAPAANQSEIVGGAAINCGRECTIVQTPETLTVSRIQVRGGTQPAAQGRGAGQPPGRGRPVEDGRPRDEVVYLDGRATPTRTTAEWEGTKLVLVRTFVEPLVVKQTLSLEKQRLVVVVDVATARVGPYSLTYERR